ncbi:MAG TPA: (Fe-S)-binding protein [Methanobacterium sp.]|nr:(Fe-S)-binding protein [Methanobacterium sp.]
MIYFMGCVAREKLENISKSTEEILKHAGIDYKILENEKCCGSFLLRTGFVDEAKEVMKATLKEIKGEKVLVSCAGCYKTFKKDYKDVFNVEIDVIHTSEFFSELIKQKKLDLKHLNKKVTYHDPCHLGREMDEYETPRAVISKTADLIEMVRSREKSRCCGAGAGVRSAYPEITEEIARVRLEDAENVNAEIIITTCPFCMLNMKSACLNKNKVLDISEIIVKALKKN